MTPTIMSVFNPPNIHTHTHNLFIYLLHMFVCVCVANPVTVYSDIQQSVTVKKP